MSTFAVEMTEMSSILQNAKPTSLILVDELGRSTSSSDGFGLAWSISKRIARDIGSFTLFATHFHELCNLSNELPNVFNCHMDATNNNGIVMLYQLRPGPFSKSFGIEAAEHAGFPASVIKRAKEKSD
ncbi:MSH2 [Histomonas meleagridis]|uniref:MSH2 n=1 Tax=Histomonas meleagridis TaxID=135588 RepID=UPI00355A05E4|nr:MSH2 [Histomonas meleagridis]